MTGGLRAEYYDVDTDGSDRSVFSLTAGANVTLWEQLHEGVDLILRPEIRFDWRDGPLGNNQDETTVGFDAILTY